MHHEAADAGIGQLGETVAESRLAEQRGAGDLEYVAGDEDEVDPLVDREAHDRAPGVGGGVAEDRQDLGRSLGAQALERAVEVQVTGVEEAEGQERHGPPSVADGRVSSSVAGRADAGRQWAPAAPPGRSSRDRATDESSAS